MASDYSEDSSSTGSDDGDNEWNDWVEESQPTPAKSLFEDREFPSAEAAITHDKETHNFDLSATSTRLGLSIPMTQDCHSHLLLALDTHQRLRLINYIRSQVGVILECTIKRSDRLLETSAGRLE